MVFWAYLHSIRFFTHALLHEALHTQLNASHAPKSLLGSVYFCVIKKQKSPQILWSASVPDQWFDLLGLMENRRLIPLLLFHSVIFHMLILKQFTCSLYTPKDQTVEGHDH